MCFKKIIQLSLIVILTIFSNISRADLPKNAMYVELGGSAGAYSLNYERKINSTLGGRIGAGYIGYTDESYKKSKHVSFLAVPIMLSKLWGNEESNHNFETAFGLLYTEIKEKDNYLNCKKNAKNFSGIVTMGYRYSPRNKGFLFRIGFTPIFSRHSSMPWLGTSLGYTF